MDLLEWSVLRTSNRCFIPLPFINAQNLRLNLPADYYVLIIIVSRNSKLLSGAGINKYKNKSMN